MMAWKWIVGSTVAVLTVCSLGLSSQSVHMMSPSSATANNKQSDSLHNDDNVLTKTREFCEKDSPTNMFSNGFQSSLGSRSSCLNYLWRGWTLSTRGQFLLAVVISFLLAVATEWMSSRPSPPISWKPTTEQGRFWKRCLVGLWYGISQWLAHLSMLLSMTFSYEIFAAILLGVIVGHAWFGQDSSLVLHANADLPTDSLDSTSSHRPDDDVNHPTLTPSPTETEHDSRMRRRRS